MNTASNTTFATTVTYSTITVTLTAAEREEQSSPNTLVFYYSCFSKDVIYEYQEDKSDKLNHVYVSPALQRLITSKKEVYGAKKNFTYHYYYFCSTIAHLKYVDKRNEGEEYVSINYKIMTAVVGNHVYPDMVSNLKDWNVIQENPVVKYQAGNYSKSYKLLPPYDTNIKRIPIEDKLINQKLNQFKMSRKKEIEKLPDPYQYLSMTNTWIAMDIASAVSFNEVNYLGQHEGKYNANFYAIHEYEDEAYRFSVDEAGNRAHTNLTNLSKKLRQFLYVEGEQLGQVDISNSQPLFFYLHIRNVSSIPTKEKKKLKEIAVGGEFYEYFMRKLGIPFDKRKKIKRFILSAVFFDKYRRKESRYIKVFREDFPMITDYITTMRKRDHTTLAKLLQRKESKFVIEKVVAKFMEYFGDANEFIATIHDSIVVKMSYLEEAKKILEECFSSEGIQPKLKIEKFQPPHIPSTTITTTIAIPQNLPLCVPLSY